MKISFSILFLFITNILFAKNTVLTGIVTNEKTHLPLTGVSIYINELNTGAITDSNGKYELNNLPESNITLHLSLTGYNSIVENINLKDIDTKDFAMKSAITEMHEAVITGLSKASTKNKTATPITTISKTELLQTASTNIIDAVAKQAGIAQITTGAGISKPVIRGLGYNRVIVVADGIRQEGNQWGDEHGIEIDENAVNKVEILKGAASLSYGSDAIAGVINMLSAPTLPMGKMKGALQANYQSNNGLVDATANIAGNKKGIILDMRYSQKIAHDYKNKYDGYVYNSGYKEHTISGIIGINKKWGFSHLHISSYNLQPEITEGKRDSATGKFTKPIAINSTTEGTAIVADNEFTSYKINSPYQKIQHNKIVLNSNFLMGNGNLKTIVGYQQNSRKEFANILQPNQYGLAFLLNTFTYDIRYALPEKNNYNINIGINGMQQNGQNKGTDFLVPAYHLFDFGAFVIAQKNYKQWDFSGGIRIDNRSQSIDELYLDANGIAVSPTTFGAIQKFSKNNLHFNGMSASLGATYQISEKVYTKLNFAKGYRAPNIAELGSNGIHEGTNRYEIGNTNLKPENSLQIDYALGINTEHVSAEINVFNNTINNYIFSQKLSSVFGGDSIRENTSAYKFGQGNANLMGAEITIDLHPHPLDWLHVENSFGFVNAIQKNQPDSTKHLPSIPPAKYSLQLKANVKKLNSTINNAYASLGIDNYFAQNKIYNANHTETATPAYSLLDIGIGGDIMKHKNKLFSIYCSINNVFNTAYQSHLSRLKYEDINNLTNRTGVYNMGRNASIKIMVPFG